MIEFVQANLNKAELAHVELVKLVGKMEDFLAIIQEPYRFKGKLFRPPAGTVRIPVGNTDNSRAAILASNSVGIIELKNLCSPDCAVGMININGVKTVVASLYFDINFREVITQEVKNLVNFVKKKGLPLIMGIDTNAHSTLYLSLIHI